MELNYPVDITGYWWLPENPGKMVSGRLFVPEVGKAGTLSLIQRFDDNNSESHDQSAERILGISSENERWTLTPVYATKISGTKSVGSYGDNYFLCQQVEFAVLGVYRGANFPTAKSANFTSVRLEFAFLNDWITDCRCSKCRSWDNNSTSLDDMYHSVNAKIDGGRVNIVWDNKKAQDASNFTWKSENYVEIESDTPLNLSELMLSTIFTVEMLLTLCIGRPCPFKKVTGITKTLSYYYSRTHANFGGSVEIVMPTRDPVQSGSKLTFREPLVPFCTFCDKLATRLESWFSRTPQIIHVLEVYRALTFSKDIYLTIKLLLVLQGIEAYHRTNAGFKQTYTSNNEYVRLICNLQEAIDAIADSDLRASLHKKIEFGNEVSQRKRLRDVLKCYKNILHKNLTKNQHFVTRVITARNFYTHYPSVKNMTNEESSTLVYDVELLEFILKCCLLSELAFNVEEITDLTMQNRNASFIIKKVTN